MMTKGKSKQIKQVKYLLLLPLLASMLFYTACSDNETTEEEVIKQPVTVYKNKDGKIVPVSSSGYKSKYLDLFLGFETPNSKEVSIDDLTESEREEYQKVLDVFNKGKYQANIKIYESLNNRKMIFLGSRKNKTETKEYGEDVPFAIIEKAPTFPGCEEGDKSCLNKSLQNFVKENFDTKLTNTLGLSSGKKRIYVQFKIDKDGSITDVKARAPHPKLKETAMEMIKKLPKMIPGEHQGKKVRVAYTLPITFVIE